jgi:hypothetical protein
MAIVVVGRRGDGGCGARDRCESALVFGGANCLVVLLAGFLHIRAYLGSFFRCGAEVCLWMTVIVTNC